MRLPETFRITVTNFGVKIFDPIEGRMMWLSKPTFSTLFMGAKSFEIKNIPPNCIRANIADTGRGKTNCYAMVYPESKQKVIWADRVEKKYHTVEIPMPHSLWIVLNADNRNIRVQIYAVKNPAVRGDEEFTVYHFPFPNSNAGMTCYGGNDYARLKIQELLPVFYGAPFTKELIHNNVNGFKDTWDLFIKLKDHKTFPYDCLVSAGSFESNWRRYAKGENE